MQLELTPFLSVRGGLSGQFVVDMLALSSDQHSSQGDSVFVECGKGDRSQRDGVMVVVMLGKDSQSRLRPFVEPFAKLYGKHIADLYMSCLVQNGVSLHVLVIEKGTVVLVGDERALVAAHFQRVNEVGDRHEYAVCQ